MILQQHPGEIDATAKDNFLMHNFCCPIFNSSTSSFTSYGHHLRAPSSISVTVMNVIVVKIFYADFQSVKIVRILSGSVRLIVVPVLEEFEEKVWFKMIRL